MVKGETKNRKMKCKQTCRYLLENITLAQALSSVVYFSSSCFKFPDPWRADGSEPGQVPAEWSVWLHPEAAVLVPAGHHLQPRECRGRSRPQTSSAHRSGNGSRKYKRFDKDGWSQTGCCLFMDLMIEGRCETQHWIKIYLLYYCYYSHKVCLC